ncbi:MAG: cupin domain-containing protein [Gammaproteobacteria bacterium]
MTESAIAFLNTQEGDAFLRDHWQQSPAFFERRMTPLPALPDWRLLMASEGVESRRIVTLAPDQFSLTDGPLAGQDPPSPWTILIQDAEHHAPDLRCLIEAVDFLPRWRVEDVMMSVATAGGSVGPHVDAYDVFLVQAQGSRQWDIGRAGDYERVDDDSGLRLVKPFLAARTLIAKPGDVLYLPPDVPHHGVALDDCVTYSIGFRAPTLRDLAAVALDQHSDTSRYRDAGADRNTEPLDIDRATLNRLREQLEAYLTLSDRALATALGELMTEPKPWLLDDESPPAARPSAATRTLVLSPGARLARFDDADSGVFFANGQAYVVPNRAAAAMLATLGHARELNWPDDPTCQPLIEALLNDDIVRWRDDHGTP